MELVQIWNRIRQDDSQMLSKEKWEQILWIFAFQTAGLLYGYKTSETLRSREHEDLHPEERMLTSTELEG